MAADSGERFPFAHREAPEHHEILLPVGADKRFDIGFYQDLQHRLPKLASQSRINALSEAMLRLMSLPLNMLLC